MPDPLDAIQSRQAERRRLREAATAAPWEARGEGICCGVYKEPEHYSVIDDPTWADAQFVAHCRNDDPAADVDACLAEIERLKAELDHLEFLYQR